ncbi:hypothetical protein SISNIDRAFT_469014 [Sistotremastrum niveocremeum HHB9708]|uniref:Uncharacterized protein n=1 Tax=Sistotremastrum niveocremeum HHB9708 TaxID=1314777 RepID=A0A164QKY2_9AGAM|nr:hypothetical protein SISNIDRAFT_469014 [Sistotremastrum niveocremeum HHB9708]
MPPVRVFTQPPLNGLRVFTLEASGTEVKSPLDTAAAPPSDLANHDHHHRGTPPTAVHLLNSDNSRDAGAGDRNAGAQLATFPRLGSATPIAGNGTHIRVSPSRETRTDHHAYAIGEKISLQVVDMNRAPTWTHDANSIECSIFRNGHQVILRLDRIGARALFSLQSINTAFLQSHDDSVDSSSPLQTNRAMSPFDPSPVVQDPERPYRLSPIRHTRTARQGPAWVLWRETAAALLERNSSALIVPLVSADTASPGDVYELRYTVKDRTYWVRQETSLWLPSLPGIRHPVLPEYILHLREETSDPSWIKAETKKKYDRELEKAKVT